MCIRDSLDTARTARLAAAEIIRRAEEKGFKPVYAMKSLKAGEKVYWNQKDKSVILAVIGKEPVSYTHLDVYKRQVRSRSADFWILRICLYRHSAVYYCLLLYPVYRPSPASCKCCRRNG